MSLLTVAKFNELHQKTFGFAPTFGQPVELSRPPSSRVSVTLTIEGEEFLGTAQNQKLARQAAIDTALECPGRLPPALFQAIDRMI
jgi:hypothetical protein